MAMAVLACNSDWTYAQPGNPQLTTADRSFRTETEIFAEIFFAVVLQDLSIRLSHFWWINRSASPIEWVFEKLAQVIFGQAGFFVVMVLAVAVFKYWS